MSFKKGEKPAGNRRIKTIKGELIENAFANEFVRNGLSGVRAYKALRPETTTNNAHSQSTRLLRKDGVLDKIKSLLPSDLADFSVIEESYKAPREEVIRWGDLQKFVRLSLELKGYVGSNRTDNNKQQVNVQLVVEK